MRFSGHLASVAGHTGVSSSSNSSLLAFGRAIAPKRRSSDFAVVSLQLSRKSSNAGVQAVHQQAYDWFVPVECPLTRAMEHKIKEQLEADSVVVRDTTGDARHVRIDVVSKMFEGQSEGNRQKMVYIAILEEIQTVVHAVDEMNTRTPSEVARDN